MGTQRPKFHASDPGLKGTMPRQSRSDKILAEQEARLLKDVDVARGCLQRLESEIALVRDLRKQLAAPGKAKTKNRVAAVANASPSVTEPKLTGKT